MSKKTFLSTFALMLFTVIALGSGSSSQHVTKSSSSKSSESRSLDKFKGAEFPKTAQTCTSCMGLGCASCNYTGTVLR